MTVGQERDAPPAAPPGATTVPPHAVVLDLAHLPKHGRDTGTLTWWGNVGYMLIEGTGFAMVLAMYLYLYGLAPSWPPGVPAPSPGPGTAIAVVLLLSVVPNLWLLHAARRNDMRRMRIGLVAMSLLGFVPLVLRVFEFGALNVLWDDNAYGSVVWLLLGLHTLHLATDVIDTIVLAAVMFTDHGDNPRRHGDVQDNASYWNFVVASWGVVYACVYGIPRW